MSEFHRMITYLYLYEQGRKSRNIGFAKIERRDRQCLLEIHMKNTGCSLTPVPVYFYVQKETKLIGIPLGSFSLIRGSGDFKVILDAENIKDSGYALDDVKGIYVPFTVQMMSVSQWDDDEFHQEDFVDINEMTPENGPQEEKPQALQAAENPQSQHIAENSQEQQTTEDSAPLQEKTASADEDQKSTDALTATEALPRAAAPSPDVQKNPGIYILNNSSRQPKADDSSKQSQADIQEDWKIRWQFIQENYPVMTPFAGDDRTICIRMELKDLRQLPRQFWYLGNNSFLLHGFFNYRYYILGMTEEFGIKKWFIGVPGVFQNPERVMAALFGFPGFRSEKPSPIKTGEFGYWYRYLNELSEPTDKSGN